MLNWIHAKPPKSVIDQHRRWMWWPGGIPTLIAVLIGRLAGDAVRLRYYPNTRLSLTGGILAFIAIAVILGGGNYVLEKMFGSRHPEKWIQILQVSWVVGFSIWFFLLGAVPWPQI
jgi:uncharacterized membrane protein YfcA